MRVHHLIDGKAVEGRDWFETVNPATQEVLAEVASGTETEVNAAVAAAKAAFPKWAARPAAERAALMVKLGDLIKRHVPELADTETRDTGQTISRQASNSSRARPTISTPSPRCAPASTATPTRRRRT